MPGYTLNLWVDKQSAEEICKKEGYSVISARGIMKDLGYDIKNLKTIYKFSNRVLSELFAYLPETKSELYYSIRCIVESIIFEVDQIKECQQPSFRYISSNSVYIWRYNGNSFVFIADLGASQHYGRYSRAWSFSFCQAIQGYRA